MNPLEELANATVDYVQSLPLQSFLPHDTRNRTGYHACMIIFYQLLRELSKFEKRLYLWVDHSFINNIVPVPPVIDPFGSDTDNDNNDDVTPILLPEQVAELRIRYLTASSRRVAAIWNNYSSNVKRACSNRAIRMNALPVHGMYTSIPVDSNNVNSFLTQTVYEDATYVFRTIQNAVKKGSISNPILRSCNARFGPDIVRIGTTVYQKNVVIHHCWNSFCLERRCPSSNQCTRSPIQHLQHYTYIFTVHVD